MIEAKITHILIIIENNVKETNKIHHKNKIQISINQTWMQGSNATLQMQFQIYLGHL